MMKVIDYVKVITNVKGKDNFERSLMEAIREIQGLGYEVDFKYAIENISVHSAVVVGYKEMDISTLSAEAELELNNELDPNR
jgi:hypothetical protein